LYRELVASTMPGWKRDKQLHKRIASDSAGHFVRKRVQELCTTIHWCANFVSGPTPARNEKGPSQGPFLV